MTLLSQAPGAQNGGADALLTSIEQVLVEVIAGFQPEKEESVRGRRRILRVLTLFSAGLLQRPGSTLRCLAIRKASPSGMTVGAFG